MGLLQLVLGQEATAVHYSSACSHDFMAAQLMHVTLSFSAPLSLLAVSKGVQQFIGLSGRR